MVTIQPETALSAYLQNEDASFEWQIESQFQYQNTQIYQIILVSQQWREHRWKHTLTVVVPNQINQTEALLFIAGGSIQPLTFPTTDQKYLAGIIEIAQENNAITALINQVPNQPLYNNLKEDALISYTLHQYKTDRDFTWPLLFPMVKSVVRAMDAVQDFGQMHLQTDIDQFMLSGYSKRGWTTWLTSAVDARVQALAPAVIDVLNMPVNVDYQVDAWGDYSIEIQDYVNLGIAQDIESESGQELVSMIDPYSYRSDLDQPKLLLIGTNDPYWPVDAVKNYINDIPGQNYIYYTPNAGHDLKDGQEAFPVLSEFFSHFVQDQPYPHFSDVIEESEQGMTWSLTTDQPFIRIEQWQAYSNDRDFRDETWEVQSFDWNNKQSYTAKVTRPTSGYLAIYWNVVFPGQSDFNFPLSSRMYVMDKDELFLAPGK